MKAGKSLRSHLRCTRSVEAGCRANETPVRRSVNDRTGRGTNPPLQFGQTLSSTVSTQSAQEVYS